MMAWAGLGSIRPLNIASHNDKKERGWGNRHLDENNSMELAWTFKENSQLKAPARKGLRENYWSFCSFSLCSAIRISS